MTASLNRRLAPAVALLAAVAFVLGLPAMGSATPVAGPVGLAPSSSADNDGEGGSKTLREQLEEANKGFTEAKATLENSKKRQLKLQLQLEEAEAKLAELNVVAVQLAKEAYRSGRLSSMTLLLNSGSPDAFLERAVGLDAMTQRDNNKLRELRAAQTLADRAKAAIDNEVRTQQKQVTLMEAKKKQAERALAAAGGGRVAGGFISANSPLAKPAPRNADGSWPKETCTVDDPTTSGCITPRTLHAMQQAKAANFTRYVSCFRSGGGGEHPKGRACDFSAAKGGFANVNATGGDKAYGDNLAAYFVKNASRLGVMYVIWYRQIWQPSTGWRSYSGCCGPAATHTNHVHLSML